MNYKNAKVGILLLLIGASIEIFTAFILFLGVFVDIGGGAVFVFSFAAAVLELIGIIFCGVSDSENFKKALICVCVGIGISLLGMILLFCIKDGTAAIIISCVLSVASAVLGLLTIFYLLKGIDEVSNEPAITKLSGLVWKLAIVDLIMAILFSVLCSIPQVKQYVNALLIIMGVLLFLAHVAYSVCYIILLAKSYNKVKSIA